MLNDTTLLLDLDGVSVARVERLADGRRRVLLVTADETARACPACGVFATRVKGSAVTRPRDLPSGQSGLEFRWHKRRWWCREADCPRRSFTEQIPQIPAGARLTARLRRAAGRRIRDAGSTIIQAARDLHLSWPTVVEAFRTQARDVSGCVYPHVRANATFSLSEYGAAAATYLWAQQNLPDGWGDKTPLRRYASESGSRLNRERACGYRSSDPFEPFPDAVVQDDSCDEFPFARTYEGGTNGALCADILPKKQGDQWFVVPANPTKPWTFDEPCVRGHVPLTDNSAAGGELGRFAQNQRVLDLEKYSVTITA